MTRQLRSWGAVTGLAGALALGSGCGGGQSVPEAPSDPVEDLTRFSADRAWIDLEMLAAFGPRPAGSDAADAARDRILAELAAVDVAAEVVETIATPDPGEPIVLRHVVATLPGAARDRLVLVARYDSGRYDGVRFVGVNEGASGAVVLLDVARVLSGRERPYTIDLVWLEGEGPLRGGPDAAPTRWLGSRGLAERWASSGRLDRIRLLVALDRVCDADLRLARDLGSQRTFREQFWSAARRAGRSESFVPDAAYEGVAASHLAFRERGLREVVAIADTAFGGDRAPGLYAESEKDSVEHCAPESLETVGVVVLEGVDAIGRRLAKIDRFAQTPSLPDEPEAAPEADEPAAPEAPEAGAAQVEPAAPEAAERDPSPEPAGDPSPETPDAQEPAGGPTPEAPGEPSSDPWMRDAPGAEAGS